MHAAPAVTYPVGRSRLAAVVLAGGWTAGAAAAAAWSLQAAQPGWRQAAAAAVLAACGAIALANWRSIRSGTLAWDGLGWTWSTGDEAASGAVGIALDLQSHLLVHWKPRDGRGGWLWLEQGRAPLLWDALRRAVYSPATSEAPHRGA